MNSVINNRSGDGIFDAGKDEYLCIYFNSKRTGLGVEDVEVVIDGYGAPLLTVTDLGRDGLWQANLRLPPGIETAGGVFEKLAGPDEGSAEAPVLYELGI